MIVYLSDTLWKSQLQYKIRNLAELYVLFSTDGLPNNFIMSFLLYLI